MKISHTRFGMSLGFAIQAHRLMCLVGGLDEVGVDVLERAVLMTRSTMSGVHACTGMPSR